jgi:hypothetical protein
MPRKKSGQKSAGAFIKEADAIGARTHDASARRKGNRHQRWPDQDEYKAIRHRLQVGPAGRAHATADDMQRGRTEF